MPTSNLLIAPQVLWMVHEVEHRTVLDVGPGWGKYATLLREYLNEPPERIDAVEAWPAYVDGHRLRSLYDDVMIGSCLDVTDGRLAFYDVVLMVDVIEHIPKAHALSFLRRVPGRVVISTPVEFFDTGPGLPHTEQHISHWTVEDFEATGRLEAATTEVGGLIVRLGPS